MPAKKDAAPEMNVDEARAADDGDHMLAERDAPQFSVEEIGSSSPRGEAAEPTAQPPSVTAEEGVQDGIAAWHSKKIVAMWCKAGNRVAYASVDGMGWRRINNGGGSAFLSLVAMLSHAEQTGAACRLRIESDNMIHEAYVW